MEEPGELQSLGSQRVGHNLATEQQQQFITKYFKVSNRWLAEMVG